MIDHEEHGETIQGEIIQHESLLGLGTDLNDPSMKGRGVTDIKQASARVGPPAKGAINSDTVVREKNKQLMTEDSQRRAQERKSKSRKRWDSMLERSDQTEEMKHEQQEMDFSETLDSFRESVNLNRIQANSKQP